MDNASISAGEFEDSSPMPRYSVSFLTPAEVGQSPAVLAAWQDLLGQSTNLYRLYQSPEWWNHQGSVHSGLQRSLGVVRDGKDAVVGVVPLQIGHHAISFWLGSRNLGRMRFRTIDLLGSHPLLPDDENAYRQLFRSICDFFSDCRSIRMFNVIRESWCCRYFEAANSQNEKNWFLYSGENPRLFHIVRVPATFEEYMKKFSSKRRHALRREMKILEQRGAGDLQLERIENVEQIDRFLAIARPLFDRSWKAGILPTCLEGGKPHFEDLARRGILRAYLLRCGDSYCAYVIGYQFRDVYHGIENAHDSAFNEYSPGKVMQLLVIEDLTNHTPPEKFSFGFGNQDYKVQLGTDHAEDATIVLMRRTLANRFKCGCHQTFRSSVRAIKRGLGRNTPT
ncbi:MAG: GNAT family N-acetyltransferase [Planctomycetota bacterium]